MMLVLGHGLPQTVPLTLAKSYGREHTQPTKSFSRMSKGEVK